MKAIILASVFALAAAMPAVDPEGPVATDPEGNPVLGPDGDVMPMLPYGTCYDCLSNGLAWNKATSECVKLGCKSADCVNDIKMCYAKPVKPVKPVEPDCEEVEPKAKPAICTNLPAGLCKGGVMVPDVAYTVEEAIFGCDGKACKETNVWCEIKQDKKGNYVEKYTYCCGDKCKGIPEEETCEYKDKDYVLGKPYDKKDKEGKKYTMWFTSCDEEPVKCYGKKCGSTPELTPPGIESCPVPKPPVVKPPVKPLPPVVPVKPIAPQDMNCITCVSNGGSWNENLLVCYPNQVCPLTAEDSCHSDLGRCPVRIEDSMAL